MSLPILTLSGPPQSGKTSTAMALASAYPSDKVLWIAANHLDARWREKAFEERMGLRILCLGMPKNEDRFEEINALMRTRNLIVIDPSPLTNRNEIEKLKRVWGHALRYRRTSMASRMIVIQYEGER